jgi:hypothetical protein
VVNCRRDRDGTLASRSIVAGHPNQAARQICNPKYSVNELGHNSMTGSGRTTRIGSRLFRRATMKNAIAGLVTAISISALAAAHPAHAGSGDVAAGLIGGFAAGAIVGTALAPRPAPVYVAPAPVYVVEPQCYWTRGRPMWDGYRWVRTRVQVCD